MPRTNIKMHRFFMIYPPRGLLISTATPIFIGIALITLV
jgi:hypothetical protein